MKKKGQFTLFVIIGLVILVLVGLGIYFKDEILGVTLSQELAYPSEIQEIVDHVQECIEISSKNAVIGLGLSGGYYNLPINTFYDLENNVGIAYYYYDSEDLTVSVADMEIELNDYIKTLATGCIDLEQFSYTIDTSEMSVVSSINDDSVDVSVDYPLIVTASDNVYTLTDSYDVSLDVNLYNINSVASNIVRNDINNPDFVDLNFLLGQGLSNIEYVPYDNNTIIYVLKDSNSFDGEGYTFMFASYFPYNESMTSQQFWESWL